MQDAGRTTSDIWYHFTKGDGKGKCRYCNSWISMSGGSSSNLKRHLTGKHPLIPLKRTGNNESPAAPVGSTDTCDEPPTKRNKENREQSGSFGEDGAVASSSGSVVRTPSRKIPQATMTRFVDTIKPMTAQKSKAIDTQLLKMVCKEYHPFSIVEDKEFKQLLYLLNPSYTLPSRKTLSTSLLPTIYKDLEAKVIEELSDVSAISLTCDGWTSITNTSFYALTAHFIDKNGILRSFLLECSEFSERHTAQNIADWITRVLEKFNVQNKIVALVTDNAANMKAAARILKFNHLGCFAHSLNLVVQNAIKNSIVDIVEKCKSIVQFFKKNSHAAAKFQEMQIKLGKQYLKPVQDVPTRWNATFDMMERLILRKEAVISTLALVDSTRCTLDSASWEVMERSVEILRVFNEVTNEISSEKSVSLSKTAVLNRLMIKKLQSTGDSRLPKVKKLVAELSAGLNSRFGDREANELVAQAIILDPRFKRQGFSDEDAFQTAYKSVVNLMESSISTAPDSTDEEEPSSSVQISAESSLWKQFDESVSNLQSSQDPAAACSIELDKYLAEAYLHRNSDPLVWWETRKNLYPKLHQLMLKRLCITATSVPCERIFSKAGQLIAQRRTRLTSKHAEQIMFVNVNFE